MAREPSFVLLEPYMAREPSFGDPGLHNYVDAILLHIMGGVPSRA